MALFACRLCCRVENTEYGFYKSAKKDEPVLCSECHTGTWHGKFPRRSAFGMTIYHDGWLAFDGTITPSVLTILGTVQFNNSFPYYHGFYVTEE